MTKQQKELNDKFNALPHNQQRVEIAKDVIKWLELGKLTPMRGDYLKLPNKFANKVDRDYTGSFQDIVKSRGFNCEVCAKGAILACTVNRKDGVTNGKVLSGFSGATLSEKLGGVFSPDQLELIENAFEDFGRGSAVGAHDFYIKHNSSRKRMIAIMRNIIRNDGTFIPWGPNS